MATYIKSIDDLHKELRDMANEQTQLRSRVQTVVAENDVLHVQLNDISTHMQQVATRQYTTYCKNCQSVVKCDDSAATVPETTYTQRLEKTAGRVLDQLSTSRRAEHQLSQQLSLCRASNAKLTAELQAERSRSHQLLAERSAADSQQLATAKTQLSSTAEQLARARDSERAARRQAEQLSAEMCQLQTAMQQLTRAAADSTCGAMDVIHERHIEHSTQLLHRVARAECAEEQARLNVQKSAVEIRSLQLDNERLRSAVADNDVRNDVTDDVIGDVTESAQCGSQTPGCQSRRLCDESCSELLIEQLWQRAASAERLLQLSELRCDSLTHQLHLARISVSDTAAPVLDAT